VLYKQLVLRFKQK